MKLFKRIRCLLLIAALSVFVGCENGGGEEFDFGENNPDLYIAIGDSITRGTGTPGYPAFLAALLGKPVENRSVGGTVSKDAISAADRALRSKPGTLLILYGSNDAIHGLSRTGAGENLRTVVQMAIANMTLPVIATIPHMTGSHAVFDGSAADISALIREIAATEGARLVDLRSEIPADPALLQPDGLHPTEATDMLIAELFSQQL